MVFNQTSIMTQFRTWTLTKTLHIWGCKRIRWIISKETADVGQFMSEYNSVRVWRKSKTTFSLLCEQAYLRGLQTCSPWGLIISSAMLENKSVFFAIWSSMRSYEAQWLRSKELCWCRSFHHHPLSAEYLSNDWRWIHDLNLILQQSFRGEPKHWSFATS